MPIGMYKSSVGAKQRKAQFFKEDDGAEPLKEWLKRLKRKNRDDKKEDTGGK